MSDNYKGITLVELQQILGEQIQDITDKRIPFESRVKIAQQATAVSSLAKQMINNADVILRADKLFADSKLNNSNIMQMVNGGYALTKKNEDGTLIDTTL